MSRDSDPEAAKGTSRRTIVRTGAKLAYAAPLVAASTKFTSHAAGANGRVSAPDCLGSVWDEFEYFDDVWHGTWTRVSGNSFSASWTGPGYVTADLKISVVCKAGGVVSVERTGSSDGNDCTYSGTYDGTNGVSGTYTCTQVSGTFPWHATIS